MNIRIHYTIPYEEKMAEKVNGQILKFLASELDMQTKAFDDFAVLIKRVRMANATNSKRRTETVKVTVLNKTK